MNWNELISYSGSNLLETYIKILQTLGKQKGLLGDIFAKSLSAFSNPTNLKKLLNLIDEIDWTSIDIDGATECFIVDTGGDAACRKPTARPDGAKMEAINSLSTQEQLEALRRHNGVVPLGEHLHHLNPHAAIFVSCILCPPV